MPIFDSPVGPEIPEDIQKIRNERRRIREEEQKATIEKIEKPAVAKTADEDEDGSSSSDDDGFGPQLPPASNDNDDEKAALERLQKRSVETPNKSNDRSNWLRTALGDKDEPSYNPKTFRRNPSMNLNSSETQATRSKRLADEMMGLGQTKTEKTEEDVEEPEEDKGPSLLEQHKSKKSKSKNEDDSFNWEKDMKKANNKKLSEFLDSAKSMNDKFHKKS